MGRIVVKFEGLCVLFTENMNPKPIAGEVFPTPSLTVGLVGVNERNSQQILQDLNPKVVEITPEDFHSPRITINELTTGDDGLLNDRKQLVFEEISGDLYFDTAPNDKPISQSTLETIEGDASLIKRIKKELAQGEDDPKPYKTVSVAKTLYPGESDVKRPRPLQALCSARLHFKTGALFSLDPRSMSFGVGTMNGTPIEGTQPIEPPIPGEAPSYPIKACLEIELPEEGYGLLSFSNDKQTIKFDGRKNYEISVVNQGINSTNNTTRNHFLYYYSIFSPIPQLLMSPVNLNQGGPNNNPYCSVLGDP